MARSATNLESRVPRVGAVSAGSYFVARREREVEGGPNVLLPFGAYLATVATHNALYGRQADSRAGTFRF